MNKERDPGIDQIMKTVTGEEIEKILSLLKKEKRISLKQISEKLNMSIDRLSAILIRLKTNGMINILLKIPSSKIEGMGKQKWFNNRKN